MLPQQLERGWVWAVRLEAQAESDFADILTWTTENLGELQADIYAENLTFAIETLHDGPELLGAKARDQIEPGIRILHVARQGRNGRHFVVFSEAQNQCIGVLRLLHDSMDLARHFQLGGTGQH